jgi:hypothetical protein
MTQLGKYIAVVVLLVAAPCAQAQEWRHYFEAKTSEFSPEISLVGKPKEEGSTSDTWVMVMFGRIDKRRGEVTSTGYVLKNTYRGSSARRWTRASTSGAELLIVDHGSPDVRNCYLKRCEFDESILIVLPVATLQKAAEEDIRVRVSADRGEEFIFPITKSEAQALLYAIAELAVPPRK